MSEFDFKSMSNKLDEVLENETKENVIKWLEDKHKQLTKKSEVGVEKLVSEKFMEIKWEDINWIIKYVIKNGEHLEENDTYLIEKFTDECQLAYKQR